jgi:hypothetical protein
LSGSISANPAEDYVFTCWGVGPASVDASAQTFMVVINYDVTFFERKLIPQS